MHEMYIYKTESENWCVAGYICALRGECMRYVSENWNFLF